MCKLIGQFVLFVAVSIGLVGKFTPNLFLKIPEVGFIPWAITGNPMPPHFHEDPLYKEHFRKWAEDGDVIVASGPKSGTMWLHAIIHNLRVNGDDEFDFLHDAISFTELANFPEHTLDLRIADAKKQRAEHKLPFAQWFSHKAPGGRAEGQGDYLYGLDVQKHPNIKYVAISRNGKEVTKSFFHFINSFTKEFRSMWGGFPPPLSNAEAALDFTLNDSKFYFDYVKGWWAVKDEPNVLLLHFSDLKRDHKGVIVRIAKFLEISVSDDVVDKIVTQTSHAYMSARPEKYEGKVGYPGQEYTHTKAHIRKGGGKADGGGDFFTEEMNAAWEEAVTQNFGSDKVLLEWATNGGSW